MHALIAAHILQVINEQQIIISSLKLKDSLSNVNCESTVNFAHRRPTTRLLRQKQILATLVLMGSRVFRRRLHETVTDYAVVSIIR